MIESLPEAGGKEGSVTAGFTRQTRGNDVSGREQQVQRLGGGKMSELKEITLKS